MALPSTGFDTATVTNPGSALTDFTLMVDLSKASASWWSAVDTADGTKGRAAKSDGTELATDWIAFDNSAKTGWLRVKWTGTLAASGSQVLRIYPPNTSNSSNAANATYGSDNAYDASWEGYWPLGEASGDAIDRTSHSLDAADSGTLTYSQTGKVGNAVDFGGGEFTFTPPSLGTTYSLLTWAKTDSTSGNRGLLLNRDTPPIRFQLDQNGADARMIVRDDASVIATSTKASLFADTSTWYHVAGVRNGNDVTCFGNASAAAAGTASFGTLTVSAGATIGGTQGGVGAWNGLLDDVQLHSAARSADWIAEEYAQTNDNATFWGTWTWNAPAGGIPVVMYHRRMMGVS
jgi:hypothetical protein